MSREIPRMLIIDDEQASCRTLKLHFGERGFEVDTAYSADEGITQFAKNGHDVVISDIRMPNRDGLSLLKEIRERSPDTPVIMITAFQDLDNTVAAMHSGAADCVPKPIDIEELEAAVDRAIKLRDGGATDGLVIDHNQPTDMIVGRSRSMQEIFKAVGMVSRSRVTALVLGESGTGKELVARAIHMASADAKEPFVAVNCAALVETLLESEMFGHERGSFTGAVGDRKGKAEIAGDGTLFLDEVSELSLRMQGKILRLLEEREFTPVGGNRTMISRARFIAATNVNLEERVADGRFREDLFYRLNVVSIRVPPLRERRDDISLLVEHLLKKINREIHRRIRHVPKNVMSALTAFDWPGNVRQLENVLTRSVVMAQGDVLDIVQLPDDRAGEMDSATFVPPDAGHALSLKEVEREHIIRALAQTDWHKGRTCEILGISRPRLERRIREYGISRDDIREN